MAPFGTLYTLSDRVHPRTRKILGAAALNGLELEIPANFEARVTNKTPEFLAKFPLGQIPSFEGRSSASLGSGSDSPFFLAESSAIAQYVADSGPRREQLLGRDAAARVEPAVDPGEGKAEKDLRRWLERYEGHLKRGDGRAWFVNAEAEGPSLADLVVGGTVLLLYSTYMEAGMREEYPHVLGFYERLKEIPELTELYSGPLLEKRKEPEEA
ncbi:hypothetical protein PG997_005537 [Apiospora hydei]|uniref:Glutathione S-transferase n=1 Tax=Apiospora hydei TaxID=1337664 RepID=A0ABR1WL57_9PEZI